MDVERVSRKFGLNWGVLSVSLEAAAMAQEGWQVAGAWNESLENHESGGQALPVQTASWGTLGGLDRGTQDASFVQDTGFVQSAWSGQDSQNSQATRPVSYEFSQENDVQTRMASDFSFPLSGTGDPELAAAGQGNSIQYDQVGSGPSGVFSPKLPVSSEPISIMAQYGWQGTESEFGQVYILAGDCRFTQGSDTVVGAQAVVWVKNALPTEPDSSNQVVVYLETGEQGVPLQIELNSVYVEALTNDQAWLGTFRSTEEIRLFVAEPGSTQLNPDEIFYRANLMNQKRTSPTNETFTQMGKASEKTALLSDSQSSESSASSLDSGLPLDSGSGLASNSEAISGDSKTAYDVSLTSDLSSSSEKMGQFAQGNFAVRKIRLLPRHETETAIEISRDPLNPEKIRCVISNGITIIVEGISNDGKIVSEVVELSADSAVIWAAGIDELALQYGADDSQKENQQVPDQDLEFYLQGDITFREGERTIYAQKMYYDAKNRLGLIQDVEMLMPIPDTPSGMIRVQADSLRQTGPKAFSAQNTWVTTSMMGYPTYRLQSNSLVAQSNESRLMDTYTGQPVIDPKTGKPQLKEDQYFIAENNFVAMGPVPVFYWPWMAMDTRDQTLYLRHLKVANDSVFGTQVRSTWNMYQLLNMSKYRPEGTDWDLNLDYLSKRGIGHGMNFVYDRESIFGCQSRAIGLANFYGIRDKGMDNLGLGRREVGFKHPYRYRGLWKHRHILNNLGCLGDDWVVTGQAGFSSDRNYLAEYFEKEWLTSSNPETSLEIKKTINNSSIGLMTSVRTNDFYTQTSWLPRLDHYWIGQPICKTGLVWYEHSKAGIAQFKTTTSPYATEDKDLFRYLDWELSPNSTSNSPYSSDTQTLTRDAFTFSTRHELDLPVNLGPINVTPYGLGEYAFWGAAADDKSLQRLYGRGGVRANLPFWKVNSDVSNKTWYLNGVAHKTNFAIDASYSSVNQPFSDMVLYEPLDDWQIEEFRRRYSVTTFGGMGVAGFRDSIPVRFDERYYAIRHGKLAGSVTSPSTEIADDLSLIRLDWQNRWQTKRGSIGKRHMIDWITFDTGLNLYPKKEENEGELLGLIDYDFRWHVGDRFSVLSSGLYDVFQSGQKITRVGVMSKRPSLSSIYLGIDRLFGPIDSTYFNMTLNYRMSEKWASAISNSYDLSEGRNVGQEVSVSRIGESFIFTLSGNVNQSKDNWGVNMSVEPVFLYNWTKKDEGILGLGNM